MAGASTFPLYPTDDGWPYAAEVDTDALAVRYGMVEDGAVDFDALELRADRHAFDALTATERLALTLRFERGESMREIAAELGCSRRRAGATLGHAIEKVRARLLADGS